MRGLTAECVYYKIVTLCLLFQTAEPLVFAWGRTNAYSEVLNDLGGSRESVSQVLDTRKIISSQRKRIHGERERFELATNNRCTAFDDIGEIVTVIRWATDFTQSPPQTQPYSTLPPPELRGLWSSSYGAIQV